MNISKKQADEETHVLLSNENPEYSRPSSFSKPTQTVNGNEKNRITIKRIASSFFEALSKKSAPAVQTANEEFYISFSGKSPSSRSTNSAVNRSNDKYQHILEKLQNRPLGQNESKSHEHERFDPGPVTINSVNISYIFTSSENIHKLVKESPTEKHQSTDHCLTEICKEILPPIAFEKSFEGREQEIKADQLFSFLHYGRNELTNFIRSSLHLEAERMLIQTKVKHQIIKDAEKYTNSHDLTEKTISNIICHINPKKKKNSTAYYVLMLIHNGNIFITEISKPIAPGCIAFDDSFTCKSPAISFDILGKLYNIQIKQSAINTLKRFFSRKKASESYDIPVMKLIGEVSFTIQQSGYQEFSFQQTTKNKKKTNKLAANFNIKTLM